MRGRKNPRFIGVSIVPRMEICKISGLLIRMVPRLHQRNGYIRKELHVWRAQKLNALVCAEIALTSARLQTIPFHGCEYGAKNGNMRNLGPTKPHGTAIAPKQWLDEKEATCMESS